MPTSGPIVIIEDDHDDQEILKEVFRELKIPNILRFFNSCKEALCYLLTTIERPFIIISDINLPAMNGFELKDQINQNQYLRRKNIPFLFLSTNSQTSAISTAYDLFAQGYFVKPPTIADLKEMVLKMIDYWRVAKRPAE
jgi:CheY-like chemotaxis protein